MELPKPPLLMAAAEPGYPPSKLFTANLLAKALWKLLVLVAALKLWYGLKVTILVNSLAINFWLTMFLHPIS